MGDSLAAIGRDIKRNAATLLGLTALLWLVQVLNVAVFHGSLIRWGIQPRTVQGLPGILVHPFLHAGWQHLISNTIGFLMLGGMVMLREPRDFWTVSGLSLIVGGVGIWLFGRPGPHIGASGIVFGYFGYLLLTGWFDRRVGPIILSILTLLLWGRLLFGLSPFQRGISWEGHLFGTVGRHSRRVATARDSPEPESRAAGPEYRSAVDRGATPRAGRKPTGSPPDGRDLHAGVAGAARNPPDQRLCATGIR